MEHFPTCLILVSFGVLFLLQSCHCIIRRRPASASYVGLVKPGISKASSPIALQSVDVSLNYQALAVGVSAELTYLNTNRSAVESEFVFPIAVSAAVYSLQAEVNGQNITGTVYEKREARRRYRQTKSQNRTAILLENRFDSPDVYRLLVGRIEANQTVKVRVRYAQPAERDEHDNSYVFTLPIVLNPRYVAGKSDPDPERDRQEFHLKSGFVAVSLLKYTMTFKANIDMQAVGGKILSVRTGHKADVIVANITRNKRSATVTQVLTFHPDHDFTLVFDLEDPFRPSVYVEPGLATSSSPWLSRHAAAVWFDSSMAKAIKNETFCDEFWFVFDRSGSMRAKNKITHAKAALQILIRSLPQCSKFNVISFGSNYTVMFPRAVTYSPGNRRQALEDIQGMRANMERTVVLQPLRHIYDQAVRGTRRYIVLLTDGEVTNTNEVVGLVGRNKNNTKVFSIGIGNGASTALVDGVARASGGLSDYFRDGTRTRRKSSANSTNALSANSELEEKVAKMLVYMVGPSVDDLHVSWRFNEIIGEPELSPQNLPIAVVSGRAVAQYALFSLDEALAAGFISGEVFISGMISGSNSFEKSITFATMDRPGHSDLAVHRLAAKAKLLELVDEYHKSNNTAADKKSEAIDLSLSSGIVCEFTGLLAEAPDGGLLVDKEKPFMSPRSGRPLPNVQRFRNGATANLTAIIDLQKFRGNWELRNALLDAVAVAHQHGRTIHDVRTTIQEEILKPNAVSLNVTAVVNNDRSIGTLVAIAGLRYRFPHRVDTWRFIARKGFRYLKRFHRADKLDRYVIDSLVERVGEALGF